MFDQERMSRPKERITRVLSKHRARRCSHNCDIRRGFKEVFLIRAAAQFMFG